MWESQCSAEPWFGQSPNFESFLFVHYEQYNTEYDRNQCCKDE